jgi:hypothetical protein
MKFKSLGVVILFVFNILFMLNTPVSIQSDYNDLIFYFLLSSFVLYLILFFKSKSYVRIDLIGYIINILAVAYILTSSEIFHETGEVIYRLKFLESFGSKMVIFEWVNIFSAIGIILFTLVELILVTIRTIRIISNKYKI